MGNQFNKLKQIRTTTMRALFYTACALAALISNTSALSLEDSQNAVVDFDDFEFGEIESFALPPGAKPIEKKQAPKPNSAKPTPPPPKAAGVVKTTPPKVNAPKT